MRFNWHQYPVQVLQTRLQTKGIELDILENNPILFTIFKQKLYDEFQRSFQLYHQLLKFVTIKYFREKFLLKPIIWNFTREWLPIYLQPLAEMIKIEQFDKQMQLIWNKICNEYQSLEQIRREHVGK